MRQWIAMPQRIDGGRMLAGVGAVALVVSLFLEWFGGPRGEMSAWTSFEVIDILLAGLGVAALAAALPVPAAVSESRLPWIGAAAFVFVAVALVNRPPSALGDSLQTGAWIGFAGAILILVGGILTTTRISIVISVRSPDERTHEVEERDEEEDVLDEADDLFEDQKGSEDETATMPAVGRRSRTGTRA